LAAAPKSSFEEFSARFDIMLIRFREIQAFARTRAEVIFKAARNKSPPGQSVDFIPR
jgi:hypothetical protein